MAVDCTIWAADTLVPSSMSHRRASFCQQRWQTCRFRSSPFKFSVFLFCSSEHLCSKLIGFSVNRCYHFNLFFLHYLLNWPEHSKKLFFINLLHFKVNSREFCCFKDVCEPGFISTCKTLPRNCAESVFRQPNINCLWKNWISFTSKLPILDFPRS